MAYENFGNRVGGITSLAITSGSAPTLTELSDQLKDGVREDECNCPIALAVQDAVEQSFCDDHDVEKANVIVTVHEDDINVHYHKSDGEMELMFSRMSLTLVY